MCKKSVWMGIGWMVAICLFLSCSEEKESGPEPLDVTFPEAVQEALAHYFPNQEPSSAEELVDEENGISRYAVLYEPDAYIVVDEKGEWQSVICAWSPLPAAFQEEYAAQFQTVAQERPDAEPRILSRTVYGITIGVGDGDRLAFAENSGALLGYERLGYDITEVLPGSIYVFIDETLAAYSVSNVLVPVDEEFSYKVYWKEGFCISFDASNQWVVAESLGDAYLPSAFLASLPDEVKEMMTTDEIVRVERKIEPETIQYYVEATGGHGFGISMDNPNRPILFPTEAIDAFISTYFGLDPTPKKIVYSSSTQDFRVCLPNGFDFVLNEAGEWLEVDGNGTPLSEMKQLIIDENILQQAEAEYQTTITFVQKEADQLVLRDEAGNAYIYKDNTFQRLEGIWEPMEKAYRYIRHHYPEDFDATFIYSSPDEGIIYQLGNGEKVRFDVKGDVLP